MTEVIQKLDEQEAYENQTIHEKKKKTFYQVRRIKY